MLEPGDWMGLRQQQRDRTEDAIVTAAYRLFAEQGYDDTTVEEIAAASDVSPRTFYRYFESKSMTLAINGFRSVDGALATIRPGATIREMVRALVHAIMHSHGHAQSRVTSWLLTEHPKLKDEFPIWRSRWADYLADGLAAADGRDVPNVSDRFRAEMAMTITGIAVEERMRHGGDLFALAGDVLARLDAGLRTHERDVSGTRRRGDDAGDVGTRRDPRRAHTLGTTRTSSRRGPANIEAGSGRRPTAAQPADGRPDPGRRSR